MTDFELFLSDVMDTLNERKKESEKLCKENPDDDFENGRSLGYFECIEAIKSRMDIYGIKIKK